MDAVRKECRTCGREQPHRVRPSGGPKTSCMDCERAYLREWRQRRWQVRKAYDTWRGMIRRCHDPSTRRWQPGTGVPSYRDYGALGIRVCRRWRTSFTAFLEDVGYPPSPQHSLDRIRNDRGYSPSNVRWADPALQAANRQNARWVTAPDQVTGELVERTLSAWQRATGIDRRTIASRLDRGWSPERATSEPPSRHARELALVASEDEVPF